MPDSLPVGASVPALGLSNKAVFQGESLQHLAIVVDRNLHCMCVKSDLGVENLVCVVLKSCKPSVQHGEWKVILCTHITFLMLLNIKAGLK